MLVKQKSLSHSCEKGFIVICYLYFSFRYMRQAFSHRNPGMIIIDRIIIKPSSRINLSLILLFPVFNGCKFKNTILIEQ